MLSRLLSLAILAAALLPQPADAKSSRKARSEARAELGRAYLQEGSLESAIGTLREAIELDKSNWIAWTFLGLALAEKGKPEDAEKAYQTALRYEDERAEPHHNYGLFLFGRGRVDDAVLQYELALEDLTYRKPSFVLNNLGFALIARGDYGRAVTSLREAVRRAPNLCPARFNLGMALEGNEQDAEALKSYQDVIDLCGEEAPGAYLQAGRLMIEQERDTDGITYLYRVLDLAPDSDAAKQAEQLLADLEP